MNGLVKIWVDDVRPMPEGYTHLCRSVNECISVLEKLNGTAEVFLDLDHDAGDFAPDGGDYIRILDYIEAFDLNINNRFTFSIHSMNVVGRQNMLRIIRTRGWRYTI